MTKSLAKGARLAALGLASAMVLSLAAPAFAAEKPAGLTAAIDAKGQLRQPTAAEAKVLAASIPTRNVDSLKKTVWADGTVSIDLLDAFLNTTLVQVQADGTLSQVCVDSAADANAVLVGAPLLEEK